MFPFSFQTLEQPKNKTYPTTSQPAIKHILSTTAKRSNTHKDDQKYHLEKWAAVCRRPRSLAGLCPMLGPSKLFRFAAAAVRVISRPMPILGIPSTSPPGGSLPATTAHPLLASFTSTARVTPLTDKANSWAGLDCPRRVTFALIKSCICLEIFGQHGRDDTFES